MNIFGSPQRYYQGPGLLDEIGELTRILGDRAVLISDVHVLGLLQDRVRASLATRSAELAAFGFEGELTAENVASLSQQAGGALPDFVIAAGGGKGVDAGKAVAHRLGLPFVTAPTAASTDSPTSKNYVLYDDNHRMAGVFHIDRNPDSVIVDTNILAQAPGHLLLFGIGDAIAKHFEARQCARAGGRNMFGHQPTQSALALAERCYQTLRNDAEAAIAAAGTGIPTPAFERVVEATVLMAGLGFENGGLSVAHALTRGLPQLSGLGSAPHGFLISYGLMVQLKLEATSSNEHADLFEWLAKIGLPRHLTDLTQDMPSGAEWAQAAQAILDAPHMANFERVVSQEELIAAMMNSAPDLEGALL
ncbi:glycerol dehydrogenase [Pacificoceanicola onchidii]|uniref:glycerol dehydrogenase n=1 Tax=Pacificoceanicola onchidii TaxID=2562685 RepID=UPI0010A62FFB|nr:glycerol dehydrogenase [Pacificoceanicola onchidii]